ncbi:hypothetical protein NN6n1_20170 [Shinella zoogloeoides]
MPAPYISKTLWPDYTLGEVTYSFGHLSEAYMVASDSLGAEKSIIVTYADHVFTRDAKSGDDLANAFPGANRVPFGVFCETRYKLSKQLPALIEQIPSQRIWNLRKDDRYAHVPLLTEGGETILYSVVFSLEPVKRNIPFDFWLRIRTAYPCDVDPPDTFGEVRFSHLLMVRDKGQHPQRNFTNHRKKPKAP